MEMHQRLEKGLVGMKESKLKCQFGYSEGKEPIRKRETTKIVRYA